MIANQVSVQRGYVRVPAGLIHYRTAGDGPPLVMLHPNGFSSDLFADAIPLLSDRFKVIALDRLGHGYSDPLPDDFPRFAEDKQASSEAGRIEPYLAGVVLSVLDELGIDSTYLLGQHTGSHVSIELTIRQPERVKKLILVSITDWSTDDPTPTYEDPGFPGPTPYLHVNRLEQALQTRARLQEQGQVLADGSHLINIWRSREESQASAATTPEIMHRITMMAVQCMPAWPDTSPNVILYYHASRRLPLIRVPTLIMAGEHDKAGMFIHQQKARLPADIPSRSIVVRGAGAFFALEKPAEFAKHVGAFLAEL